MCLAVAKSSYIARKNVKMIINPLINTVALMKANQMKNK